MSQIKYHGVQHYLGKFCKRELRLLECFRCLPRVAVGLYHTAEEAARAYDRRLREFYGPDSPNTNFPNDRVAKEICAKAAKKNGTKLADLDTPDKKKQPT